MLNQLIKEDCPNCGEEISQELIEFVEGTKPHSCPKCGKTYYCVEFQPYKQVTVLAFSQNPGVVEKSNIYIDPMPPLDAE